ncbi:ras association domain-containing protein 4 [Ischnura elegans]|uniref:ras association domain-containing protein 4 n=1 Tax=Ischnura elegans TaxID=197161 RepID=UPI001ED88DAA|nr:ras association domain-containing protein 4 [Ischnura elegans]
MWKCHKCGKPVYFAERKQSLGYDWHPECLRCEECGKRLNPGQHAEHKGVPYCHVPCYGALFGPQLFGHGTRVESHTSFGKVENRIGGTNMSRSHLETKIKAFNQYYDGKSGEIRSREVNGRLVLEGALRIHWGVLNMIHLKEDDDQRTVVTIRKRNSYRSAIVNGLDDEDDDELESMDYVDRDQSIVDADELVVESEDAQESPDVQKCLTLPVKLGKKEMEWDELDDLLQVERQVEEGEKVFRTMPSGLPTISSQSSVEEELDESVVGNENCSRNGVENGGRNKDGPMSHLPPHVPAKTGSTAIRRRPGGRLRSRTKLKRRCSINGHFYNRETSFFTPPYGSQMSVWVTSLVSTNEVINLMLEKYKVDSKPYNFALFVVRDNGEQRRLRDDEYPLLVRVMLGPHEDVAKLFLMDRQGTEEISSEVAQFLNLSIAECRAILEQFNQEEEREAKRTRAKYREMRRRIKQRMEELKVRL